MSSPDFWEAALEVEYLSNGNPPAVPRILSIQQIFPCSCRIGNRAGDKPKKPGEKSMITASELREGMALRIDKQIYRVIEVESRAGAAKMGGTVRARLCNVRSGRIWDQHFRPQERLEDLELERRKMEFLYGDGTTSTFLRLDSFEQVELPSASLGLAEKFLQPGIEVPAEFFE